MVWNGIRVSIVGSS